MQDQINYMHRRGKPGNYMLILQIIQGTNYFPTLCFGGADVFPPPRVLAEKAFFLPFQTSFALPQINKLLLCTFGFFSLKN